MARIPFTKETRKKEFRVSIFGSRLSKKNSKEYKQIYRLAKELGARNIDVVTGAGDGIMEAASKGHREGRGTNKTQTIGLNINIPTEQKPNQYIDVIKTFKLFSNRLNNFKLLSNSVVIANGGIGTLLEFFYTWQLVQSHKICDIPIILIGNIWPELIKWLQKELLARGYFDQVDMRTIFIVKDDKEALKIIDKAHEIYDQGKGNICMNIKQYKLK